MKKRVLSTALVLSMLLSMVPMNVMAVESQPSEIPQKMAVSALPELEFAKGLPMRDSQPGRQNWLKTVFTALP